LKKFKIFIFTSLNMNNQFEFLTYISNLKNVWIFEHFVMVMKMI